MMVWITLGLDWSGPVLKRLVFQPGPDGPIIKWSYEPEYNYQKGTKTSGIYLFGLHLKTLERERDKKRCAHVLKQVNQCSYSILTKRATNIGKHMLAKFNEKAPKLYNSEDIPILENEDKAKKKQKMNQWLKGSISRGSYRRLCAIESRLPREGAVSKERQKLNEEMAKLIPISIVDINTKNQLDESEEAEIDDEAIVQGVIDANHIY
ncbi:hypothetical protein C1645_745334 [Glomus cerebriforme]|uniref:Uncharacterized protein n=1 Tax=Glomus cerebriforme TaxID=658196 RepID=A0A397S2W8_9GLOM|nr:hypothetical protein C1645_745334 [Glomus cerebriforme]